MTQAQKQILRNLRNIKTSATEKAIARHERKAVKPDLIALGKLVRQIRREVDAVLATRPTWDNV